MRFRDVLLAVSLLLSVSEAALSQTLAESNPIGLTEQPSSEFNGFGAAQAAHQSLPAVAEGFFDLSVNGIASPNPVYVLIDASGAAYMAEEDFRALDLSIAAPVIQRDGVPVVPLFNISGLVPTVDRAAMRVVLEIEPGLYQGKVVNLRAPRAGQPLPALPGAYLNYTLQGAGSSQSSHTSGSAVLDAAVFNGWGFLQSSHLQRINSAVTSSATGSANKDSVRLATAFFRDDPDRLATFQLGDGISVGEGAAPALRYGGISYGSNFGLRPGFTPFNVLDFSGSARVPTTIEFLLNDRRVASTTVPAGPFAIQGIPTITGAGEVTVIARDALGNERLVALPFFQSPQLYRAGVYQFNYTAGYKRPDYDVYREPFASTSQRYGLTDWLTIDGSAAFDEHRRGIGAGATFRLFGPLVANISGEVSDGIEGTGHRSGLGLFLTQQTGLNASLTTRHSSQDYRRVGDPITGTASTVLGLPQVFAPERNISTLGLSRHLGDLGSLRASYTRRDTWDSQQPARTLALVGWNKSFGRSFNLAAEVSRSDSTVMAVLRLVISLDNRDYASASVSRDRSRSDGPSNTVAMAEYASPLPTDYGLGYRLGYTGTFQDASVTSGAARSLERTFGSLSARTVVGLHSADVESFNGNENWRFQTAGSVGWLDGQFFGGQPINGAFVVATTGDATGVPILRENNPVGETNRWGWLLVPNVQPFAHNNIGVRAEDVPFEFTIDKTDVSAIPASRGGVLVNFPMKRQRAAVLLLTDPAGAPLKTGLPVTVLETGEESAVGLRGEAYVSDLPETATVRIQPNGFRCDIKVANPKTSDPQPRLGPYVCKLEKPANGAGLNGMSPNGTSLNEMTPNGARLQ